MNEFVRTVMRMTLRFVRNRQKQIYCADQTYTTKKWQMIKKSTISARANQLYDGHLSQLSAII